METLDAISRAVLEAFLARPEVTPELRAVFAARGIKPGPVPAQDDAPSPVPVGDIEPESESEIQSAPKMVASLPVINKVKLALSGTREQRSVLVRDANKVVAVAPVMGSPKLNVTKVEAFTKMSSVQEEVLRIIGTNSRWVKHYPIAAALVGNARPHSASPWGS
jgi:hypothetical protein